MVLLLLLVFMQLTRDMFAIAKFLFHLLHNLLTGVCSAQRRFYGCVYAAMTRSCNEDIASVIVEFNVRKYSPPFVAGFNCNLSISLFILLYVLMSSFCRTFFFIKFTHRPV